MKFAEIGYIKENEPLWVSDFVLKLPKWIKQKYFLCCVPLKVEEISIAEEKGIKITLPIKAKEEEFNLYIRMIRKTVALLMEKNIKIVINGDRIPVPCDFLQARGSLAMSYFISQLVKNACEENKIDLAKANIVVIDGKNIETFIVLNSLMGEINHLSIRTDDIEALEKTSSKIYEETGLVTEFFVSPKGTAMKTADIIINCNDDLENFDYVFKKGAVYIEASPYRGKLSRLMSRRPDMKFLTDIQVSSGGETLDAVHTEALFLIKCTELEKGIRGHCSDDKKQEILDLLRSFNFSLSHIKR